MSQIYLNPESIKDGSITIEKLDTTVSEVLGGVPIVDSIESLDSNAEQGSLGVVVKNYVETYSIRDSFVKNENPVALNELRLSEPNIEVENIEYTQFIFGPKGASIEDMMNGGLPGIGIAMEKNENMPLTFGVIGTDQIFNDYGNDGGAIILYSNGVIDEEKLTIVNEYIKDKNFVLFGASNMDYDESQPIENLLIDPTGEQFDLFDAFLGYEIVDKSTTLYIKESEGWKEFNLDVVNDFNGGIDKALSAEMGKVLNEKISGFVAGNTTEPIKFKGYVNVETTKDIDKIYDNMQIGEACLVAPSVKGDASTDSYVPWIYTATQNDWLPLGDSLLKSNVDNILKGEVRTYFTLDKNNPTWRCPDMLLLAKVKVKIKQFVGILDLSSTLKNIINLLPDSTEITACIGKILRWSTGDVMDQFAEEIFNGINTLDNLKTKYPWGTKLDNMLTSGICAYTPDTVNGVSANWTVFVTRSSDTDSGGYYHLTQTAICRDDVNVFGEGSIFHDSLLGRFLVRMGYYKGSEDNPSDLHFLEWNKVGLDGEDFMNILQQSLIIMRNSLCTKTTYYNFKNLRDNDELVPGASYRITDYITTTTSENTKSANHQFDIIVTADSSNTLSHLAKAALHEGDTYFENCNLEAWKLWYDLDNNADKYEWADAENGKGVIYRMIDEHNNDCPYDFKNIMFYTDKFETIIFDSYYPEDNYYYTFSVYKETEERIVDQTTMARYYPINNCMGAVIIGLQHRLNKNIIYNHDDPGVYPYENKFSNICVDNIICGEFAYNTLDSSSYNIFSSTCSNNTLYRCSRNTFGGYCNHNTFGGYCNHNTFGGRCENNKFGYGCENNTFGTNCAHNTFRADCSNNTFGDYCENNKFGYGCCHNTFGNECKFNTFKGFTECQIDNSSNTLGDNCCYNTFGTDCCNNVLGNSCYGNIFGNDCCNNIFKDDCHYNIFGESCSSIVFSDIECSNNTFGDYCNNITFGECCEKNNFGPCCSNNTFGDSCYNNTFGNSCSNNTFGVYCSNIIFENNCIRIDFGNYFSNIKLENVCKFIHLNSSTETAFKNELQNIKISSSICGTQAEPIELTIEPNRDFETKVAKNSKGEIKIYCEADLISE